MKRNAEVEMRSRAALIDEVTKAEPVLYTAIDVGPGQWSVVLTDGNGELRSKTIEAGNFEQLEEEIDRAARYFELGEDYTVACCHEVGRDGFWIHRALEQRAMISVLIDPGSLREKKKKRRAKTDRVDAEKIASEFVRWCDGHREHTVDIVRVPSPEDEDERHLFREHDDLVGDKTSLGNTIEGLLKTQGIEEYPPPGDEELFEAWLEEATTGDGRPLGRHLKRRLRRLAERLRGVLDQIRELEDEWEAYLDGEGREEVIGKVKLLNSLRGLGVKTSLAFVVEMYGWREFQNRREIGAYVGMDGERCDSGTNDQDRPITRQGNTRIRTLTVQMARCWLRWQPDSELTEWARRRFSGADGTVSHKGVVALGRKLLNRFRVYLNGGPAPNGARFSRPDI